MSTEFLTPAECAAIAKVGRQQIYRMLKAGTLTRFKFGRRTLVKKSELMSAVVAAPAQQVELPAEMV